MYNRDSHHPNALRPNPDVVVQRVEEGTVLVHMQTNDIYELNDTGSRLWQLLAEGLSLADIKARLLEEFDVAPGALERELAEMLTQLERAKLVLA